MTIFVHRKAIFECISYHLVTGMERYRYTPPPPPPPALRPPPPPLPRQQAPWVPAQSLAPPAVDEGSHKDVPIFTGDDSVFKNW